jgi:chemotaxis protein CheD
VEDIVYVQTGDVKSGSGKGILQSTPIGSCVAIMAWAQTQSFGAMAHVMLPGDAPESEPQPTKYATIAIDALAAIMAPYMTLQDAGVCLVGAANVLNKKDDAICGSNIQSITAYLDLKEVPLHVAVLGGHERRTAFLYLGNGRMAYVEAESPERVLWPCKTTQ